MHSETQQTHILERFSSYSKALRIMCYVFRFINKCKKVNSTTQLSLTQDEMKFSKNKLIILAQKTFYFEEYECCLKSQALPNKSSLKSLNPFIDSNSILRVNGRLSQSSLPYREGYPIILPGNSHFCKLYLKYLHEFLSHAECGQMCRMVQTEFLCIQTQASCKKIIRYYKTCIIYKQQPCSQIMAPLPPTRCNLSLPFQITGIDFAGPFKLKASALRKSTFVKGYVSVFVCFSTKTVHLEVCSDRSSAAFQAAFSRFVGRRGLPQRVVSDNGRNFLGASRELLREFSSFIKNVSQDIAQKYLTHGFEWKFIPPHAPHMGGLWEAAVKSFKFHLKRITGAQKFTFEEFSTIITRIEGVLNSRPISALSEDPSDLTPLTPGHFLRGAPIMALPEQDYQNITFINRWEKLKAMHHQFSIRWKNAEVRISIAEVRISSGIITRPIVKLCYLPFLSENHD
ncbi:uncharacterized protein LOC124421299 [Lucilia cuprina]|uniref:uncharacterized protein LOC124421299 n=1 Tax=Lucilia cuprina TaxID=7375 RepID=UPI001F056EFD|nr:uncharacterized protein LOC124421299 [Lucilia cuprina]